MFETASLSAAHTVVAPDGSLVRPLLRLPGGSMAHFTLSSGQISIAVAHRTVEEIWFVVSGKGQMWRQLGQIEEIVELAAGVSLTIPVGTRFQFRAAPDGELTVVAITMPPWPGEGEAYEVPGPWPPALTPP
jgi:mannose-6-phosphate isomerase-like protein (cupin superfamily)